MKTLEQLKGIESGCIDGRDIGRLVSIFVPFDMIKDFGREAKDGIGEEDWNSEIKDFTRENILTQLEKDVAFGFEKALNKRGLSADAMHSVVKMWNSILEEGLEDFDPDDINYAQYGLPLFKATAVKYGWDNPIGEDSGTENKYA